MSIIGFEHELEWKRELVIEHNAHNLVSVKTKLDRGAKLGFANTSEKTTKKQSINWKKK